MHHGIQRAARLGVLLSIGALMPALAAAQQGAASAAPLDSAAPRPVPPGTRTFALPVLGYTPETKLVGGLALIRVMRRPDASGVDRPSSISSSVVYTQRSQLSTGASGEWWAPANRWRVAGGASFARFPYDFYGIGNGTPDLPEPYVSRSYGARIEVQRQVRRALYVGGSYAFQNVDMLETEEGGLLARDLVTGSDGGRVSMLGASTSWDTRDDLYWPTGGSYVQLSGGLADRAFGSSFDFNRLTLDARRFFAIGRSQVIAVQGIADFVRGNAPFDRLPQIGGQYLLRGYLEGRYRDRTALAVQAEYRRPVWRRLGIAVFGGVGDVAHGLSDFTARDLKTAGGVGLRWSLGKDERLNVRFDLGVGRESGQPYITLGEAF